MTENIRIGDDLISRTKKGKVVTADQAVRIIKDSDTVATGGFVGIGFAEEVALALEKRFTETSHPAGLTLVYAAGQGDGKERGLNRIAHPGLLKRVIGGHWGLAPKLQKMAIENKIEAYNLPQGVISHMFRDIAAHKPRTITSVGLGTFVDPRNGGGRINDMTKDDMVEIVKFDGREYLAYKTFPVDIAIIRGTTADTDGNVSMEKEALTLECLAIAMAAKNSGGFVIVQVERVCERGAIPQRMVKIPGILVDCVVVAKPENHCQTFATPYNPAFAGEFRVPVSALEPLPLDERKIIARRAAFELIPNSIVNLGIGMPEGVASVAAEEGVLSYMTLTAEPGVIGGIPAGGLDFGAAVNVDALVDQPYQFDFYDGGGLDVSFLGLAQVDRDGNLNVSRFGPKLAGAGGFINISQNTKKVVFVGTFTAGGLEIRADDGKLKIIKEGKTKKFVRQVEQITFSGKIAAENGKTVYYVTERCVFKLVKEGLELIEVAPGVDIEKDILGLMDFAPVMNGTPKLMDARIFKNAVMGIKSDMLDMPVTARVVYNSKDNILFNNFEGLSIRDRRQIAEIRQIVENTLAPVGKKVYTIVNYDNFDILPELVDEYLAMVREIVEKYYINTTRHTTSAFMRMKLGDSLKERGLAAHLYSTSEEAHTALKKD